jgi:hypothetical protein
MLPAQMEFTDHFHVMIPVGLQCLYGFRLNAIYARTSRGGIAIAVISRQRLQTEETSEPVPDFGEKLAFHPLK